MLCMKILQRRIRSLHSLKKRMKRNPYGMSLTCAERCRQPRVIEIVAIGPRRTIYSSLSAHLGN